MQGLFVTIMLVGVYAHDGNVAKDKVESSLLTVHQISTESRGSLCVTHRFRSLEVPMAASRYDDTRQKADMAAAVLQDVGIQKNEGLPNSLARNLLSADEHVTSARVLTTNSSNGLLTDISWWVKSDVDGDIAEPRRKETAQGMQIGRRPDAEYPWYEDATSTPTLRSPKFAASPPGASYKGWWTFPYYSCETKSWLLSYSVQVTPITHPNGLNGFLSLDIDLSDLYLNQCESNNETSPYELDGFWGSHKCHKESTQCEPHYSPEVWARGAYQCVCRQGYYSLKHPEGFNGSLAEVAYEEERTNISTQYSEVFKCQKCAPGCITCVGPAPCLATYNWPFRVSLLAVSITCALCTVILAAYMYQHRKIKIFKVASPIFLTITLLGCAVMYLEMAAIFPVLDIYSCIATKWSRHLGFCITYTALLMKTWRVSLTYRVKSAHKVKLTDKQLLQWMFPILLVMIIYLGTWTLSAPPTAEQITDKEGLRFKQCSYNWWDHSLAIGEVLFLAWGIRVCYNVRNAESLYNEAKLITYAIYNIAVVNTAMVAFHLFIFPQAGPDIKYLLGFIRTQLSTSVTVALVFGPKVVRVLRGQGDQWDNRARAKGVTASFSLNGIGLVPEETADLFQENEELKEEIQKMAGQIEFMKIVHMEMYNRHLKPKPGGYFSTANVLLYSPINVKSSGYSGRGKMSIVPDEPSVTSTQSNSAGTQGSGSGVNNHLQHQDSAATANRV